MLPERVAAQMLARVQPTDQVRRPSKRAVVPTDTPNIAERHEYVCVCFIDIVGFTEISSRASTGEVIHLLNNLFSVFDLEAAYCKVEKIKTIGDAYMAATGLTGIL